MTDLQYVHGKQEKQLTLTSLPAQADPALTAHRFIHFVNTIPRDEPAMYLHFIGEKTIGVDELGKLPRFKEQASDAAEKES